MLSIHPPGETPQELSRRYARKGGAQCLGVTRRNLPLILGGRAGTSGDAPVLTNQLADVFTGSAPIAGGDLPFYVFLESFGE